MGITACKPGKLLRGRGGTWRVNASLHRGNILYVQQNDLGTISTSYLSNGAIAFRSWHIALSMDAYKLHTNSLTAGDSLADWTHCAFSKDITGVVKCLGQERTGWGGGGGREGEGLIICSLPFFYLYFIGAPWYTIHHGWEALWYVTDMNIILPLFSLCSRRRHFAAATRNAIRIPLS